MTSISISVSEVYLLDTGILLRLFDQDDPLHSLIDECLFSLISNGSRLKTTFQNIAEFWSVSTRPSEARGGLGQSTETTLARIELIESISELLPLTLPDYQEWKKLLVEYSILGTDVHDARLVGVMLARNIRNILTLNAKDFRQFRGINATRPDDLVS